MYFLFVDEAWDLAVKSNYFVMADVLTRNEDEIVNKRSKAIKIIISKGKYIKIPF